MRCVGCETELLTSSHYCESCQQALDSFLGSGEPATPVSDATAPAEAAPSALVLPEATMISADDKVAVAEAQVVTAEEARAETNVPGPSQHRPHAIALAATAVVVAAISGGAYWLRTHEQPAIARDEQQTLVVKDAMVAERRSSANGLSAAATTATKRRTSAAAPPSARVSVRPNPTASTPRRSVVPAVAPPLLPEPPLGPFFETTTVNESPRIAKRVEPQLPEEFRARPLSEIVIVRALVSQVGHPSRISLLRRSKTGPRLDNAVITAVNQWTFAPARKRGQAVSCWFNFAVPVG